MGFKLFDELSTEEIDGGVAAQPVELSIEEVIEADTADAEVQEVAQEIAQLNRVIEDGEAMAARLEDQISSEQAIIAQPETVAASTVVLAHESLKVTAAILGANVDAMNISQESIEKSPVTALEISIEEKESFLKKIVEQIKLVIVKVIASGKKLLTKILVATNSLEKKANALKDKLNSGEGELTDADKDKIANLMGCIAAFGSIKENISTIEATGSVSKGLNDLNEEFVKIIGNLNPSASDEEQLKKVQSDLMGIFSKKNIIKYFKLVSGMAKLSEYVNANSKETETYVPYRWDGEWAKCIYFKVPGDKEIAEMVNNSKTVKDLAKTIIGKVSFEYRSYKFKPEDVKKVLGDKALKESELKSILVIASKAAKNMKGYGNNAFKSVENTNKIIKAIGSLDLPDDIASVVKPATKIATIASTLATTDIVLNYYNNVKNTIAVVAIMNAVNGGKKEDKKVEKKEEDKKEEK